MTKHTPHPWIVRKIGDGNFEITSNPLGQAGDSVVARTAHGDQLACKANADLLAAAPCLLAGAKKLFERLPEAALLAAELRLAMADAEPKS